MFDQTFVDDIKAILTEQHENKSETKSENKSNDYIWLIVIDLMNYIETLSEKELRDACGTSEDYENRFILVINKIFKGFIDEYSFKYDGLKLDIPEYLRRSEFEIDYDFIEDPEIKQIMSCRHDPVSKLKCQSCKGKKH